MVRIPKPDLTSVGSWNQLGELTRSSYRRGYPNAAELLADTMTQGTGFNVAALSLIYPAVHLYRHFLELTLKDFIDLAIFVGPYVDDLYDYQPIQTRRIKLLHDLVEARDIVREIIAALYVPPGIVEDFDECSTPLVACFHKLDRRGDSFRYPLDKKGQAQFPAAVPVDLAWLRDEVKKLASLMDDELHHLRILLDPDAEDMDERIYQW